MAALKYDIQTIKQAASGQWIDILTSLGGLSSDILDGHHHPCPRPGCGGTDRFSYAWPDEGGLLCRQCFNKKSGDGIAALQWLTGKSFQETLKSLADYLGVQPESSNGDSSGNGNSNSKSKKSKDKKPPQIFATVQGFLKHRIAYLEYEKPKGVKAVKRWDYGKFQVWRFDLPTPAGEKQRKEFCPVHQVPLGLEGVMGWTSGYPDGPRPLYRLAEIQSASDAASNDSTMLVICGGEKATDAAAELGLMATTNAGGEKAIKHTDWTPASKFAKVVVCIDNDAAGHEFGALVSAKLKQINPGQDIKILLLPNLPPKGDIVEWIAAGGTREQFIKLAEVAEKPDPLAHAKAVCEALKIDVLGETDNDEVKIFSEYHGKSIIIKDISRMSLPKMLQNFGPIAWEKISKKKNNGDGEGIPPGMFDIAKVQESIAVIAGHERAGEDTELGQGCWMTDENDIVLVGPGHAGVWDGSQFSIVKKPRIKNLKIDMDVPKNQQWFNEYQLSEYLEKAADADWVKSTIDEVEEILRKWYWNNDPGITAYLVAGLILSTWVQSIWTWRPQVGITAASDSGKSLLFETISMMFGDMSLLSAKSTEAGIRQTVRNHSLAVFCDEFESSKHRTILLELIRTSSRGSKIYRGTAQQKAKGYGLKNIVWVTAIEIGLERSPDKNRFIMLELNSPPKDKRAKILLPSPFQLHELGQKLLAIAVRYAVPAYSMANKLKKYQFEGIHGRVVESFSCPVGMLAAALHSPEEDAKKLMDDMFSGIEQDPSQGTKDESDLLSDILASTVDLGRGERTNVARILSPLNDKLDSLECLERCGVAKVSTRAGRPVEHYPDSEMALFISQKHAMRYLLKGTKWEGQSIELILKRLPGAKKEQRPLGGHRPWGIIIPWTLISEKYLSNSVVIEQKQF